MFSNVRIYRLRFSKPPTARDIESSLLMDTFVSCGPTQERSSGWVSPRGEEDGALVEVIDGQYLMRLTIESKSVPGAVVKRRAAERADAIEAITGRKPGKKEMRDLRDEMKLSLLPHAFPKRTAIFVWVDPVNQVLVIDSASSARVDEVVSSLVKNIDGLSVHNLNTNVSPTAAMSAWLTEQDAPVGFAIDRECELKACDASKSIVKYSRHALDLEEVRQHIADGKLPTRLAMTWDERVSFVLVDNLLLRRIVFLDGVFAGRNEEEDKFDGDTMIITGELRRLIPDLVAALGGEIILGETQ